MRTRAFTGCWLCLFAGFWRDSATPMFIHAKKSSESSIAAFE